MNRPLIIASLLVVAAILSSCATIAERGRVGNERLSRAVVGISNGGCEYLSRDLSMPMGRAFCGASTRQFTGEERYIPVLFNVVDQTTENKPRELLVAPKTTETIGKELVQEEVIIDAKDIEIIFAEGKENLGPRGRSMLEENIPLIRGFKNVFLRGYANSTDVNDGYDRLAVGRAISVREYLVARGKIESYRIGIKERNNKISKRVVGVWEG